MSLTFPELLWHAGCYHHLCSLDVWSSTIQVEQQAYLLPPLLPTANSSRELGAKQTIFQDKPGGRGSLEAIEIATEQKM